MPVHVMKAEVVGPQGTKGMRDPPELPLCQTTSSADAAAPHGANAPARQAYSHSASLGNRQTRPVLRVTQSKKAVASLNAMMTTG